MSAISLTRSCIVFPIAAFLERAGAPVERLLVRAGLPEWLLQAPEGLVPTESTIRFLNQAARAEGIDDLGLRAGQEKRADALGTLGRLICRSPTLGDALKQGIEHHQRFSSHGRMWLRRDGERVQLCQAFTRGFDETWQQADHYQLMLMIGVLRLGAGPTWRPTDVQVQTGESPVLRDAEPLADARITFGQLATAVTFPRALLDAPLLLPNVDREAPRPDIAAWAASAPADDFVGSATQVVDMLSWAAYPRIQRTAELLGVSVRTLQRRLAENGTTHGSLLKRARLAFAATLLEGRDTKILDVALDAGYSDHAHFTRAFRRWTGRSPQEFRREHRHGGDGKDQEVDASPSIGLALR